MDIANPVTFDAQHAYLSNDDILIIILFRVAIDKHNTLIRKHKLPSLVAIPIQWPAENV
jgi:hypothetical protein